ncbi:MAG: DUF4358 domain-containing protein [Clostridia bacterium]|nr:DUF4358 domain-containing protein [Clostridia bacterium]
MQKNSIKRLICLLLTLILTVTLFGCSAKSEYSVKDFSEKFLELTPFSEMKSLSGSSLPSYFVFSDANVKRFDVMVSANADSADTIACFEVINKEQRKAAISGISHYLTNQHTSFKSTIEKEFNKVQNRVLAEVENFIILVVCNDTTAIWDYLNSIGAKEVV